MNAVQRDSSANETPKMERSRIKTMITEHTAIKVHDGNDLQAVLYNIFRSLSYVSFCVTVVEKADRTWNETSMIQAVEYSPAVCSSYMNHQRRRLLSGFTVRSITTIESTLLLPANYYRLVYVCCVEALEKKNGLTSSLHARVSW